MICGSRRIAPRMARSASRLCGGILPGSSTTVATVVPPDRPGRSPLLAGHGHFEGRRHVLVEPDRDLVLPERLDGLLQLHAPLLHRQLVLPQELDDVLRRDRAEQPAV